MNVRFPAILPVSGGNAEAWRLRVIALLLVYSSWAWGAAPVRFQLPLPWMGLALLVLILLLPVVCRNKETACQSLAESARELLRDPVFYTGGMFLILLAVQWWNAGRYPFFNPLHKAWEYTAPGVPWLPSAFSRPDAEEMLVWFFPAWAVGLAIRNPAISPGGIRALWALMAVNGSILALLGLAQRVSGAPGVFWTRKLPSAIFFSSFAYANHAATFFTVMFCLSAGLCIREMYSGPSFHWGRRHSMLLAVAVLNLAGATFSLSRIGIILAWSAVLVLGLYAVARGWRRLTPANRVNLAAALVGVVCFGFFIAASLPGHSVLTRLSSLGAYNRAAILENPRTRLMIAAVGILKDYPWFGVGGWGFAYLLSTHLSGLDGPLTPGLANVHNDPLQFLVEFGAVGMLLLCATLLVLSRPLLQRGFWKQPLIFCSTIGLILTVVHSLIDLPFRCPAILFSCVAILAGAGVLGRTYRLERETGKSVARGQLSVAG